MTSPKPKTGKGRKGGKSRFMAKSMILGHLERSIFPVQRCQGKGSLGQYFCVVLQRVSAGWLTGTVVAC